ncbi:MAG: bile acid:sodium symporter [Planctomycetota bacterium]
MPAHSTPAASDADPSSGPPSGAAAAAAWVRRWLVALLVGSYLLAAFAPGPGRWLRELSWSAGGVGGGARFSLVMVGVLLFCGAASVRLERLREPLRRPLAILATLLAAWALPIGLVSAWGTAAAGWLAPEEAAALAVGIALAGAMPVANSAVAWTHQSGGALAWALALVLVSISVCPWVSPLALRAMGLSLSGAVAVEAGTLVTRFTGGVFIVWVLGPTLVGLAARRVAGDRVFDRAAPWLSMSSAAALLLLNYANAAVALPSVVAEPRAGVLITTLAAALTLPAAGAAVAWPLARALRGSRATRAAWAYSLGMKNTGLALGLAGATLGDRPTAVLAILAVTLTQHAVAAAVHRVLWRDRRADAGGA